MLQEIFESSVHYHQKTEKSSSELHNELRIDANKVTVETSSDLIQAGKRFNSCASEDILSNFLASAFEKSWAEVNYTVDEQDIDEPPLPGSEDNVRTLVPSTTSKFRPSRSDESSPKIREYVAMAMCRQKLHDDVLRGWISLFIDGILHQYLGLPRTSKGHSNMVLICYILVISFSF